MSWQILNQVQEDSLSGDSSIQYLASSIRYPVTAQFSVYPVSGFKSLADPDPATDGQDDSLSWQILNQVQEDSLSGDSSIQHPVSSINHQ